MADGIFKDWRKTARDKTEQSYLEEIIIQEKNIMEEKGLFLCLFKVYSVIY